MISHITGSSDNDNDNNPIEVRKYEMKGDGLFAIIGWPASNIYYGYYTDSVQITLYWQYFTNGVIIWCINTCAHVLHGPIMYYYGQLGQFNGPLGCPRSDIMTLPDKAQYAVFEHGVLYKGWGVPVEELPPVDSDHMRAAAGVDTSIDSIVKMAQDTMNAVAANAIATSSKLSDEVSSINATVQFNKLGPGGCLNPGFDSQGSDLLQSHIFNVHLDFKLKGCASNGPDATADLTVEIRLGINPPNLSAFMINYSIDHVNTIAGAADDTVYGGLRDALNGEFGRNLINKTLPSGVTVLAGLVDPNGDVSLYVEPLCVTKNLFEPPISETVTGTTLSLQRLRDGMIRIGGNEDALVSAYYLLSPFLIHAIENDPDREKLKEALSRFLFSHFHKDADVNVLLKHITPAKNALEKWRKISLRCKPANHLPRFEEQSISFIREHMMGETDFSKLMKTFAQLVDDETKRLDSKG